MHRATRVTTTLAVLGLVASACGGSPGATVDPVAGDQPLSSCAPSDTAETTTLVEANGQRPPVATMEEALAGLPDAEFMLEEMEGEGVSRADALHRMYAQVVGDQLLADARALPGFVTGAYAQPLEGEPFQLSFSGPVPEELDLAAHDLASFGLEVTTGAAGFDHDAMAAAVEAADEAGMHVVSGSGDEVTGTARIEVIDATAEQVATWEQSLDDPTRWCLVRAPRSVPCDDTVVAGAEDRADRQGEVVANQTDGAPTPQRADEVRRTYLGLTLEAARAKAAQEGRAVRVVVQDGVSLGSEDDLQSGRLNLTVCQEVVVDTRMDLEPEG